MRSNAAALSRFVLIVLFLFAFQTTALHIKHHLSEEDGHCHVCQASKHLDGGQHHSSVDMIMDSFTIEISEAEEKVLIRETFDLTQKIQRQRVDLTGLKQLMFRSLLLTYNATAPPSIFS